MKDPSAYTRHTNYLQASSGSYSLVSHFRYSFSLLESTMVKLPHSEHDTSILIKFGSDFSGHYAYARHLHHPLSFGCLGAQCEFNVVP
jgi:hypothetical protein